MKLALSKFSMDLMPITFGGSAGSSEQIIRVAAVPTENDRCSAGTRQLQPDTFTLQLVGRLFQLANRGRTVASVTPAIKTQTDLGQMKFGVEYSQLLQSCQD